MEIPPVLSNKKNSLLFPRDPIWFAFQLVRELRQSPDAGVLPSSRQMIAIPKMILARFLRSGRVDVEDFIEIAASTSPPENQYAARIIAQNLLNPFLSEKSEDDDLLRFGGRNPSTPEFPGESIEEFTEINAIYNELEFLKHITYPSDNTISIEQLHHEGGENFYDSLLQAIQCDPFKTAADILGGIEQILNLGIHSLEELLAQAKQKIIEALGALIPEQLKAASTLSLLNRVAQESPAPWERLAARTIMGEDFFNIAGELSASFQDLLNAVNLLRQSNNLSQEVAKTAKEMIVDMLSGKTLGELLDFLKAFGGGVNIPDPILKELARESLNADLKETLDVASVLDQYFGMNTRNLIWDVMDDSELPPSLEEAVKAPRRSISWRNAIWRALQSRIQEILDRPESKRSAFPDLLDLAQETGDHASNVTDTFCLKIIQERIRDILRQAIHYGETADQIKALVQEMQANAHGTNFPDGHTVENLVRQGEEIGMNRSDVLALITPDFETLRAMIEEGIDDLQQFASMTESLELSHKQLEDLVKEILRPLKDPKARNRKSKAPKPAPSLGGDQRGLQSADNPFAIQARKKLVGLERFFKPSKIPKRNISHGGSTPRGTAGSRGSGSQGGKVGKHRDTSGRGRGDQSKCGVQGGPVTTPKAAKNHIPDSKAQKSMENITNAAAGLDRHLGEESIAEQPIPEFNPRDMNPNPLEPVNDEESVPLDEDDVNIDYLGNLAAKDLRQVIKTAKDYGGNEGEQLALSSLTSQGAGSGENMLYQWFMNRHNIPAEIKARIKEIMRDILIDISIKYAGALIGSESSGPLTEINVIPYSPGDDFWDVDMEETLDNIIATGKDRRFIDDDDFLVRKTSQGLRSVVMELDISGSMNGERLSYCALCAIMMLYAFSPDEIAICFFESNTHIIKDIDDQSVDIEQVADELLDIQARGGTVMSAAVKWAADTFEKKAQSKIRINILFTDADVFDLKQSKKDLERLKELNVRSVVVVPKYGFHQQMARSMADMLNAQILTFAQWREFPKKISEILSER